jgi:hypothetical protein
VQSGREVKVERMEERRCGDEKMEEILERKQEAGSRKQRKKRSGNPMKAASSGHFILLNCDRHLHTAPFSKSDRTLSHSALHTHTNVSTGWGTGVG